MAALSASVQSPEAEAGPLGRDGMWIWYVSEAGGSAEAIARKARNEGIRLVLIKSSDGASEWSQFTPGLVNGLKSRGMTVCAWQFIYGNSPVAEARRGAEAARKGADCLVVDAESHYEGRYPAADRFVRSLRKRVGRDYPVGFTSFPWVDYHPTLPYSVFLGRGGATLNVPQVYWHTIGTSVGEALAHTYTWNLPYDRPIFPLGQTYDDPSLDEIRRFRKLSEGYGAGGVSWWSWQHTSSSEWDRVGRDIDPPYPNPNRSFPRLGRGTRGDTILLLQELLRSAGRRLQIDGTFGDDTVRALKRFQESRGFERTGVTDERTWHALRELRPVRVRWSQRGNPSFARAKQLDLRLAPAIELPPTAGRP